jgi:hypothetical protein
LCQLHLAKFWTCPKCAEKYLSDMRTGIYLKQITIPRDCVSIASNYFRSHKRSLLCRNPKIDPKLRRTPRSVKSRNILIGGAPRYLPLSIKYLDSDIKPNITPYLRVPVLANLLPDKTEVWEQYVYRLSSIIFVTAPPTATMEFRGLFKGPRPGCTLISTDSTAYHPRKGPQNHSIWPAGYVAMLAYYYRS